MCLLSVYEVLGFCTAKEVDTQIHKCEACWEKSRAFHSEMLWGKLREGLGDRDVYFFYQYLGQA